MIDLKPELGCGSVCILGVGNRDRGDDGVGSIVAERLSAQFGSWAVDGGTVPENHLEKVARLDADTVVLIDAADAGGAPGDVKLLDPAAIAGGNLSTHALSLTMASDYLAARTGATLRLLTVQPLAVDMGRGLSSVVLKTADELVSALAAVIGRDKVT